MAGSYNHVVNKDGKLETGETINSMLECMSGDVTECVTEMYGMIWYLAHRLDNELPGQTATSLAEIVQNAQLNYRIGLDVSPGVVREG